MNPYKILGISQNASQDDIKNAFRRLSKENHPDAGGDPQDFINIKKAYEMLTNEEISDTYDLYGVSIDFIKEAKKLAFNIFLEVAMQLPDGTPIDKEIKYFIKTVLLQKHERKMQEIDTKKAKLQKCLFHIVNKPEDDFITMNALEILSQYDKEYKTALLQHDLHAKALELLETYKFNLDQIENNLVYDDIPF